MTTIDNITDDQIEVGARVLVGDASDPDSEEGDVLDISLGGQSVLVAFDQGIKLWCARCVVEKQP